MKAATNASMKACTNASTRASGSGARRTATRFVRRAVGFRALALCAALSLAAVRGANAATGEAAGTSVGNFLSVGAGASVLSMAGATLASGRDLAAAAWNPASLARVDALQFSLSHAPLPGGASQEWFASGGRIGAGETRWGLQALFQQEGDLQGRDALNNPTGSLSVSDLAVGARVAQPFAHGVSAGLGVQWVHESLAGTTGSGVSFDAGLRADAGPFGFALAARNLGSGLSYNGAHYDLPGVIAAGASWRNEARGLRLNADLDSPNDYYHSLRMGGEWVWNQKVALRMGWREALGAPASEQLTGATFGFGAAVGSVWLDYGYSPGGSDGAGEHRMGLTFRPGLSGHGNSSVRTAVEPPSAQRKPVPAPKTPAVEREATKPAPKPAAPASAPPAAPASTSPPAPASTSPPAFVPTASPAPAPAATAPATKDTQVAPSAKTAPPPVTAPATPKRPTSVVVADGETLAMIARRWGTSPAAIMMVNNMVSEQVQPGMRLKLPPATSH